ncbi:MAG: response regulator transcription factor [Anaerolineae bacterium]|nr:response regulator transcription factor [Anaerolineae bacterium]
MTDPIKTLIADDHELVRAGLRDALSSIPELEVVGEVSNGPELFNAINKLRPDLLVMDVNMPDFEPVSAVKQILQWLPDLKILVVSAYDDEAYITGLLSAGARGYHLKDQPLSDLHLAVNRILAGGRWLSDPLVNLLVHRQINISSTAQSLTKRQGELLYLLSQGFNNNKIALMMGISVKTVENHLTTLYRLIGVESRLEANKYASLHPELVAPPKKESSSPGFRSINEGMVSVLLVDDNSRFRTQLGRLINRSYPSVVVREAEDSQDAYNIVTQFHPKLAFVDVVMSDEDGIKCTSKIKSISPETRVVLISAYPDRELHRLGIAAGAAAFLDKKDIDSSTIRQVIDDSIPR